MDVEEILKFADNLVFTKTGKHLGNVQEAILRGSCPGQKYPKIAEELHRSDGHVRDVTSELWEIISDILREEVNKSNFSSAIERWRFSIISSKSENNFAHNNINLCRDIVNSPEVPKELTPSTPSQKTLNPKYTKP